MLEFISTIERNKLKFERTKVWRKEVWTFPVGCLFSVKSWAEYVFKI